MVRALSKLPPSYMTARDDMESPGGRLPWDGPPQTLSANPLCPQARHFGTTVLGSVLFPPEAWLSLGDGCLVAPHAP